MNRILTKLSAIKKFLKIIIRVYFLQAHSSYSVILSFLFEKKNNLFRVDLRFCLTVEDKSIN